MSNDHPHILIIEDEMGIRLSMQMYLEDFGFRVSTAACGKEAIDAVKNDHHDLAIVDMRLGDCSGDKLIPQLLEHDPQMEILICTGSLNITIDPQLGAHGITTRDVVQKPVCDMRSLEKIIRSKLDKDHEA